MVVDQWGDGWVLILGRWVGSGGWLGLDEIDGWVGSSRWSGGRIIFGFATMGLRFARRRFATVDLGFACRGSGLACLGCFFFFGWILLNHDLLQTPWWWVDFDVGWAKCGFWWLLMFVMNGDGERAKHVCKEVSLCWDCCVDFLNFFGYFWEWLVHERLRLKIFFDL